MQKKELYWVALATALVAFAQPAAAQEYGGPPRRTVQDYGPFGKAGYKDVTPGTTSGKCGNPAGSCLFYGGDFLFDPLYPSSLPNGLANETTLSVPGAPYGAATWVPFTVPKGEAWNVTGLFTNNLSLYGVLDQGVEPTSVAYWSINKGLFPGNGGTIIDSGTTAATSTPTGRAAFGQIEFTVQVTGISVALTPGSYWMAVVPICTNTANPYCNDIFFESDAEYLNTAPTNAFGPAEPVDASFIDSLYFGQNFDPANGALGACEGAGCDAFSAGVLGRKAE